MSSNSNGDIRVLIAAADISHRANPKVNRAGIRVSFHSSSQDLLFAETSVYNPDNPSAYRAAQ
jgi:hypothetical protein